MSRLDVVYVRKSGQQQQDEAQRGNVETGLKSKGLYIPEDRWFADTRSRRKPEKGKGWQVLMAAVQAKKIGTIYVENQDRFGTGSGAGNLFGVIQKLRNAGTKLIDLRDWRDLTADDIATELQAYIQQKKSDMELADTTYRMLRGKLYKMRDHGGWPGGPPPLGYDKAYYDKATNKLLFIFHHTTLDTGDQFFAGPDGKLIPGPKGIRSPRGSNEMIPRLIPDETRRGMIADIFKWWTTETISRRQIAVRLNKRGDRMYTGEWTHANITTALRNPSYVGIVSYGRSSRAELQQFDKENRITPVTKDTVVAKSRKLADCPFKEGAHPAIIDRAVWDAAQSKLAKPGRASYAPREAEYWLKGLLICGHCGRALTPSSDKKKDTDAGPGKVYRRYLCSSYVRGRATGSGGKCPPYQIGTDQADALVAAKLSELGLAVGLDTDGRAALDSEAKLLGGQAEGMRDRVRQLVLDGVNAYALKPTTTVTLAGARQLVLDGVNAYARELVDVYGVDKTTAGGYAHAAQHIFLTGQRMEIGDPEWDGQLKRIEAGIREMEAKRVAIAQKKLTELQDEHRQLTRAWVRASESMQSVIKADITAVESQIAEWTTRVVPFDKQLAEYDRAIKERLERVAEIQKQWPEMQARQRSEALRSVVSRIFLFWEGVKKDKYTRYQLQAERVVWEFTSDVQQLECGLTWAVSRPGWPRARTTG